MKTNMHSSRSGINRGQRGAILIVALILAAITGIAVTSYLRLGRTTMELSHRTFYANAAVNLAETGLEQAMWSINQMVAGNADAWSGWTQNSTKMKRTFSGENYGQNTTGSVEVVVINYTGTTGIPVLFAKASVTPARGAVIEKWLRVELGKRGRFANGLVAKDQILFKGNNARVDSWNSDPDKTDATPAIPYSSGLSGDKGTVASISILVDSVVVQNSDIWGYAATGGAQPQVGPNGSILGLDSAAAGYTKIDPRRVSTDFTATFDPVTVPSTGIVDIAAINGAATINGGVGTIYRLPSISLNGNNETLRIQGNVTLIVSAGAGSSAIDITGKGLIVVEAGASLTVYTAGNVKIAGNGIANTNAAPKTFQLYGTSTSSTLQDVQIAGNGALKAVVYAPNADVTINGNGDVMGSVIATDITLTGEALFHYDESLADLDTGNPFGITRWSELTTSSDRLIAQGYMQ